MGFALIFVYHLPKFIIWLLELSYAYVFNNSSNLTADPKEHLKRARKMLRTNKNSLLLYIAVELRFALERIINFQVLLADGSNNMLKEYDPVKKRKYISILDPVANFAHNIFYRDKETNKKYLWGVYKPIDINKVSYIKGRLGDLLHAREGIRLGVSDDNWYLETRRFLNESVKYLSNHIKNNAQYFSVKNLKSFQVEKIEV